jgi:hypothetical protein
MLLIPASSAQNKTAASHPRPAPHIAGRFIDTDGHYSLRLHYTRNGHAETFIGVIQSTCMVPDQSKSAESKPLDLSSIPLGTSMTVYYVRHTASKNSQNIVMALRFDSVQAGSSLPQGVYVPCFKGAEASASK